MHFYSVLSFNSLEVVFWTKKFQVVINLRTIKFELRLEVKFHCFILTIKISFFQNGIKITLEQVFEGVFLDYIQIAFFLVPWPFTCLFNKFKFSFH